VLPSSHVVGVFTGHLAFAARPGSRCDSISGDQMAVLSQTIGQEQLSLWDVFDPSKITRLKSETSLVT